MCRTHGAGLPSVRQAAERRELEAAARREVERLLPGVVPVADPLSALAELAGEARSWKDAAGQLVAKLEGRVRFTSAAGLEQVRGEVVIYERAVERLNTILSGIARLRIDERLVAIDERRAAVVIAAVEAALVSAGITGTAFDEARLVAAGRLRALEAGTRDDA